MNKVAPLNLFLFALCIFCATAAQSQVVSWDKPTTSAATATESAAYRAAFNETQVGMATYYADYLAGRPTAYGETYRPEEMTASHAHLPIGTILRVTRMNDGRDVQVRVNDNSGHADGSIVTLSRAAANQIGLVQVGKTRVSVKRVGFSNWNPKPARMTSQQTMARDPNAMAPATSRQTTTNATTPTSYSYRTTQAATYRQPTMGGTQIQNNQLGESQPDFGSAYGQQQATIIPNTASNTAPNPVLDPTAYQRATLQQQQITNADYRTPNANQGGVVYSRPAVVGREVSPDQQQAYRGASYPTYNNGNQPITYSRPVVTPTEAAPVTEVQVAANPQGQGYGIQLGAYGNAENAKRQILALQNRGVSQIYLVSVNRPDGSVLNRVMAGPYADMVQAQRAADNLQKQFQLTGIVTKLR